MTRQVPIDYYGNRIRLNDTVVTRGLNIGVVTKIISNPGGDPLLLINDHKNPARPYNCINITILGFHFRPPSITLDPTTGQIIDPIIIMEQI